MLKELKFGFKMIKYAHGRNAYAIAGIIIFVLGFCSALTGDVPAGSYLVSVSAVWPTQLFSTLSVSDMVASSKWKRKMQTSITLQITEAVSFLSYLAAFFVCWYKWKNQIQTETEVTMELLMCILFIISTILYVGVAFKFFMLGTICFLLVVYTGAIFSEISVIMNLEFLQVLSFGKVALCGLFLIPIAGCIQYGITSLCYKKEISKYSQTRSLRKKM